MTRRFEYGALVVAVGLVAGVVGATLLKPLDKVPSAPKASLEIPETGFEAAAGVAANLIPVNTEDVRVDGRIRTLSIRVIDSGHTVSIKHTSDALSETFTRLGYSLDSVLSGGADVPRLFVASLPADLSRIRETRQRKRLFFQSILPLVLQANEEIKADRERLLALRRRLQAGDRLGAVDRLWLIVMAERYRVDRGDVEALVKRVDVIPPSLALAQAAEESGWGTSRFVREGNAVFGEWTFSRTGSLIPLKRDSGKAHRVKTFDSLLDSVRAYARNLNTHRAYRKFRHARSEFRRLGTPLDGMKLVDGLKSYSERGRKYVKTIRSIIAVNKLRRLDDARLSQSKTGDSPLI